MKTYRLKNGCLIQTQDFYNGYEVEYRWCVYPDKDSGFVRSFSNYKDAYEYAKKQPETERR